MKVSDASSGVMLSSRAKSPLCSSANVRAVRLYVAIIWLDLWPVLGAHRSAQSLQPGQGLMRSGRAQRES